MASKQAGLTDFATQDAQPADESAADVADPEDAAHRPAWTPSEGPDINQCHGCGAHVSAKFRRTHGDENNVAHACPRCGEKNKLPDQARGRDPRTAYTGVKLRE